MKIRNIFNLGAGSLKYKMFNTKMPLNVMFALTNKCNSQCLYCSIPERESKELSFKQVSKIINDLSCLGCQRIGFWGGEPLMRDDIGKIIRYAKSKDLYVTIDTNGHLIPEKLSEIRSVDHVIIGLDGVGDIHDATKGSGSFKKVIRSFEAFKGRLPVWTITVLNRYNIDRVKEILQLVKEYNIKATFQILHHNDILAPDYLYLMPKDYELRAAIDEIITLKKQGYPVASSVNYLNYLLNWPDYNKPRMSSKVGNLDCLAGKLFCNIDVNGDLYPCSLLVGKIKGINILEKGFKNAFDSLDKFNCISCAASCYVEYNSLFSLNSKAILSWLSAVRL